MEAKDAIKGAPPRAESLSEREYIPADRRHRGDMPSRPDTELSPEQRAWVDEYERAQREEAALSEVLDARPAARPPLALRIKQAAMRPLESESASRPVAWILQRIVAALRNA